MYNNSAGLQEFLSLLRVFSHVHLLMTFYYTDELISHCKSKISLFYFFFICIFFFQIATAVRFLQNQQVRQSPLATRKAFLKKKGEHHQYVTEPNVKYCIFCRRNSYRMALFQDFDLKFNQLNAFSVHFKLELNWFRERKPFCSVRLKGSFTLKVTHL